MEKRKPKIITPKAFEYKRNQFLVTYIIICALFILVGIALVDGIFSLYSLLRVDTFSIDNTEFAPLINLVSMPIAAIISMAAAFLFVVFEFLFILFFRLGYFTSMVRLAYRQRLLDIIKYAILFSLLADLLGSLYMWNVYKTILFMVLYTFVPFFAFLLMYLRVKNIPDERLCDDEWEDA